MPEDTNGTKRVLARLHLPKGHTGLLHSANDRLKKYLRSRQPDYTVKVVKDESFLEVSIDRNALEAFVTRENAKPGTPRFTIELIEDTDGPQTSDEDKKKIRDLEYRLTAAQADLQRTQRQNKQLEQDSAAAKQGWEEAESKLQDSLKQVKAADEERKELSRYVPKSLHQAVMNYLFDFAQISGQLDKLIPGVSDALRAEAVPLEEYIKKAGVDELLASVDWDAESLARLYDSKNEKASEKYQEAKTALDDIDGQIARLSEIKTEKLKEKLGKLLDKDRERTEGSVKEYEDLRTEFVEKTKGFLAKTEKKDASQRDVQAIVKGKNFPVYFRFTGNDTLEVYLPFTKESVGSGLHDRILASIPNADTLIKFFSIAPDDSKDGVVCYSRQNPKKGFAKLVELRDRIEEKVRECYDQLGLEQYGIKLETITLMDEYVTMASAGVEQPEKKPALRYHTEQFYKKNGFFTVGIPVVQSIEKVMRGTTEPLKVREILQSLEQQGTKVSRNQMTHFLRRLYAVGLVKKTKINRKDFGYTWK